MTRILLIGAALGLALTPLAGCRTGSGCGNSCFRPSTPAVSANPCCPPGGIAPIGAPPPGGAPIGLAPGAPAPPPQY